MVDGIDDNVIVEDVLQTVSHDGVAWGDEALLRSACPRLRVIFEYAGAHLGRLLVVVELILFRLALRQRDGVDVVRQGLVGRQDEAVVRVHGTQVGIELQFLDGPVGNTHVVVHQRGGADGDVGYGGIDAVGEIDHAVAAHLRAQHVLLLHAHIHLSVVLHLIELAGDATHERLLHVVGDQVVEHTVGHVLPRAVALLQEASAALVPVLRQHLVGRHEHHAHVLLHVGLVVSGIAVPAWVEEQAAEGERVGRRPQELKVVLPAAGEVALHEHRVLAAVQALIVQRGGCIIIGGTEAVHQPCEVARLPVLVYGLSHVHQRHLQVLQPVDDAVLALDVRLHHAYPVHEHLATARTRLPVVQNAEIALRDAVVGHVFLGEVYHRGSRVVLHQQYASLTARHVPEVRLGHILSHHPLYRVHHAQGSRAAHALALHRTLHASQHVGIVDVVQHVRVQQQLLLRHRQPGIAADAPLIVLVKSIEGVIVGYEQRLAARLRQHFRIVQVVDEADEVRISSSLLQVVVDAAAKPVGLLLVKHIVLVAAGKEKGQHDQ